MQGAKLEIRNSKLVLTKLPAPAQPTILGRISIFEFRATKTSHQSPVTNHQSPTLVLPSVPVDYLLDDHAMEFEECKRWANSEAGQAARMTNPAGFANVRAHAEAHLRALNAAVALGSTTK